MVARSFQAYDNELLTNTSTTNPIINFSDQQVGDQFIFAGGTSTTITLDDDDNGGNADVFNDDDEQDHVITDGAGLVADNAQVESESIFELQAVDPNTGEVDPNAPVITISVFSQGGVTQDIWGFFPHNNAQLTAGTTYEIVGGTIDGESEYSVLQCFAAGTMIRTADGEMAVEDIAAGDAVWTEANPAAEVVWAGKRTVAAEGSFAPIVFAPGVLGNTNELVVSPCHRMVIDGTRAMVLFGEERVLVTARDLLGMEGVSRRTGGQITYHHVMLDDHAILCSDGALSESFCASEATLSGLEAVVRAELIELFPELATGAAQAPALPCLQASEARALAV